jgi:hypothetical protein
MHHLLDTRTDVADLTQYGKNWSFELSVPLERTSILPCIVIELPIEFKTGTRKVECLVTELSSQGLLNSYDQICAA